MKRAIRRSSVMLLMIIYWVSVGMVSASPQRWYSPDQVTRGESLYNTHCSGCHGLKAVATLQWRIPDADGNYPPPPLNGTAHTWHHSLPLLRRTIREGGTEFGGTMPPFEEKLAADEIDAIIAWFQSLWPDAIYSKWSGVGMPRVSQPDFLKKLGSDTHSD